MSRRNVEQAEQAADDDDRSAALATVIAALEMMRTADLVVLAENVRVGSTYALLCAARIKLKGGRQ